LKFWKKKESRSIGMPASLPVKIATEVCYKILNKV
jgi:hypothetical protein